MATTIMWLEHEREVLRERLDAMPVAYALIDPHGFVHERNSLFDKLLAFREASLPKFSLARFVPKNALPFVLEHFRRAQGSSGPVFSEVTLLKLNKQEIPVELISAPKPNPVSSGL